MSEETRHARPPVAHLPRSPLVLLFCLRLNSDIAKLPELLRR